MVWLRTAILIAVTVGALVRSSAAQIHTNEDIVKAGDILQIALPTTAAATTVVLKDWEGTWQFTKSVVASFVVTHGIKWLSAKTRPDDSDARSFPSGHTSAAFLGPAFVHCRYGWKYSIPLYIGAAFVGYSRIYANRHWSDDVWAGASVSLLTTWYFTTPCVKKVEVSPDLSADYWGVKFRVNL